MIEQLTVVTQHLKWYYQWSYQNKDNLRISKSIVAIFVRSHRALYLHWPQNPLSVLSITHPKHTAPTLQKNRIE